ncbi:MAG: universal stress protein [Actinobacteria bacterium]|nr:universal stress protein [Actinomycetota bacterium]
MGRVTLVTVIPFGAAKEDEQRAKAMLQEQVERMAGTPGLDVLEGHPSAALERLAVEGGYDLLVIGTRGSGRKKALLGSAATEVAKQVTVPVLLVGADHPSRSAAAAAGSPADRQDRS